MDSTLYHEAFSTLNYSEEMTTMVSPVVGRAARKFVMPLTFRIADKFYPYSTYFLFCVGGTGNILSFLVLSRKALRGSNSSIYLRAMAVADFMTLFAYFMVTVTKYYAHELQTAAYCKCILWFQSSFQQISSYLVISMSLERYFAVAHPLSVGRVFTSKVATGLSISLFIIFLSFNVPYLLFVTTSNGRRVCTFDQHMSIFEPWNKVDSIVAAYIPAVVILLLNVLIVVQVRRAQVQQRKMQQSAARGQDQTAQITRMLLAVSISYWFLTIPMAIYFAGSQYFFDFTDLYSYSAAYLTQQVCAFLLLTNNSINFYLYCLTGNKFRQELRAMFCHQTQTQPPVTSVTNTRAVSLSQVSVSTSGTQCESVTNGVALKQT